MADSSSVELIPLVGVIEEEDGPPSSVTLSPTELACVDSTRVRTVLRAACDHLLAGFDTCIEQDEALLHTLEEAARGGRAATTAARRRRQCIHSRLSRKRMLHACREHASTSDCSESEWHAAGPAALSGGNDLRFFQRGADIGFASGVAELCVSLVKYPRHGFDRGQVSVAVLIRAEDKGHYLNRHVVRRAEVDRRLKRCQQCHRTRG